MKPKSVLLVSLPLNVILLALVGVILQQQAVRRSAAPAARSQSSEIAAPRAEPRPEPEVVANTAPEPFRWNRLESSDDATYIRNLREIVCPERTIRDIIGAAIGHRYDEKREALETQRKKGEIGAMELQDTLAKLWDEQNEVIAGLFGVRSSYGADGFITHVAPGVSPTEAKERHQRAIQGISSDSAPLVFLEPDPSWGLSEVQVDAWNQVYERFAAEVGTGLNPKDPAYRERWQEAQVKADQQLKALFGATNVIQWSAKSRSKMPPAPGE